MSDLFFLKYNFESPLGVIEGLRYIIEYNGEICNDTAYNGENEIVGKFKLYILLRGLALEDGYNFVEVIDSIGSIFRIGQEIFDFKSYELNENIQKHYDYQINNTDICILDRIEIIPKYRGHGLGSKVIKDTINRFGNSCGLFVLQPFPLQLEARTSNQPHNQFDELMGYELFEKDSKKACQKLKSFYKSIGFNSIKGIPELLFLNPSFKNKKLDKIIFD